MVLKTLCRAYANGNEFKVVRVHWIGRGDGYTYRVYRNRRRFTRDEYTCARVAVGVMEGALETSVELVEMENKQ